MKKIYIGVVGVIALLSLGVFLLTQDSPTEITFSEKRIILPQPRYDSDTPIEETLSERRSMRRYGDDSLPVSELSQLLWAAQGITDEEGLRTAPSAGALYPLEIYCVVGNVTGIPNGIYKYNPHNHELITIQEGDERSSLCTAALGQSCVERGAVSIVFACVYERTTEKYGDRGIRYVHMEVGHAAQNVYLQAVSLQLGTTVIGAFDDDEVKRIVQMDDDESPLYIMPVGPR
jgi:SagB-type dehydrogenase family enzyme